MRYRLKYYKANHEGIDIDDITHPILCKSRIYARLCDSIMSTGIDSYQDRASVYVNAI